MNAGHIQTCIAHYTSVPNGTPRGVTDLACLLGLACLRVDPKNPEQAVVAAKVKMSELGFRGYRLPLSSTEIDRLLEYSVTLIRGETPGLHLGAMKQRVDNAMRRIEGLWAWRKKEHARISGELKQKLPSGLELAPHQLEMVRRIEAANYRFLNLDDMGLGKTIETLASIALLGEDAFPILIVSPLSVVYNWKVETEKWLANFDPAVWQLKSSLDIEKVIADADAGRNVVLTSSWQQIITWQGTLLQRLRPQTVIGDESHYMSNWSAQRTRAFIRLRKGARSVQCLTGTFEPNGRHREAFAQLKAVAPEIFNRIPGGKAKPRKAFLRRYCDPKSIFLGSETIGRGRHKRQRKRKRTSYNGRSNDVEFGWLIAPKSLRRTKDEVFGTTGLPPKTRYKIPIELSDKDKLKIAQARDEVLATLEARAADLKTELLEAKRPREEIERRVQGVLRSQAVTELGKVRQIVSAIKIPWVVNRAKEERLRGNRVVIFCEFLASAEAIATKLSKGKHTVLSGIGSMSASARGKLVDQAQNDDAIDVVVLTQSFREGITLTRFSTTIFCDRWWLPGWEAQGEDRIHRIGQTRDVSILYPHVRGSTDEAMARIQVWKEAGAAQVLGSPQVRAYQWLMSESVDG